MAITKIQPYIVDSTQNFTFNNVTATGNVVSLNANLGNLATANYVAGVLTTSSQPNITSTGTLSSLTVTGNIIGGTDLYIGNGASSTAFTNPIAIFKDTGLAFVQVAVVNSDGNGSADLTVYGNNGTDTQSWADIGFTGNTFNDANYTVTGAGDGYFFVQGNASFGGNMVIATGNTGTTKDIIFATGGFLTGNIKARLFNANGAFTVTGNVVGGNLVTGGAISATGNANVGNIGAATAVVTTGNITTINSGLLQNGNSNVTITSNGNVTINAVGGARIVATSTGANITGTISASGNANVGNLGTAGLITATGNLNAGNIVTAGLISATGNITGGNLSVSGTVLANGIALGYLGAPISGADKTTSYTLATPTDLGKIVSVGSGGSIVIPNSTFAAGDTVSLFNNTAANITVTCSTTSAYIAGNNTSKASVTLTTRGIATVVFISGTICVITGSVA